MAGILIEKTKAVLDRMASEADADGKWTGRLTEVVKELDAFPHYSKIIVALKSSQAAEQIYRGGGGSPSEWIVKNPDITEDELQWALNGGVVGPGRAKLKGFDEVAALREMLGGINVGKAIGDIGTELVVIKLALKELESRIGKLEGHE